MRIKIALFLTPTFGTFKQILIKFKLSNELEMAKKVKCTLTFYDWPFVVQLN